MMAPLMKFKPTHVLWVHGKPMEVMVFGRRFKQYCPIVHSEKPASAATIDKWNHSWSNEKPTGPHKVRTVRAAYLESEFKRRLHGFKCSFVRDGYGAWSRNDGSEFKADINLFDSGISWANRGDKSIFVICRKTKQAFGFYNPNPKLQVYQDEATNFVDRIGLGSHDYYLSHDVPTEAKRFDFLMVKAKRRIPDRCSEVTYSFTH